MADLIDLPSWKLSTADLIQQTAAYLWLHRGDEYKDLYKGVTGARIVYELYRRVSANDHLELFQALCIAGIVEYIKANPKASEAELTKEVEKHIALFKERVESM